MESKSFDVLLNKYNIAVAKAQDLQEQLATKNRQWEKRDQQFEVAEKNMRELCESILAKDQDEMVLGRDYSWSKVPVTELITKAMRVFKEYNGARTDLMKRLMDQLEERRQEIESLEAQLDMTFASPGVTDLTREQVERMVEKEKEKEEIIKKGNAQVGELAKEGSITYASREEGDYLPDSEDENIRDAAERNESVKVTENSITLKESKETAQRKADARKKAVNTHVVNLDEWEEKLSNEDWMFIYSIGAKGLSRYPEIEPYILENYADASKNKIRIAGNTLSSMGIVKREMVPTPVSKLNVFCLTSLGKRLYKSKCGENPVKSEMDIICSEHDNVKHGYGIRYVADAIREKEEFQSVVDQNRKNPVRVSEGVEYIPDIVCTEKNGTKHYIEYEVGTTGQTSFNAKCNKMSRITKSLYIVAPNDKATQSNVEKVKKWIDNRGQTALSHVVVYVSSAKRIMDGASILEDDTWKYIFRPAKSSDPEVH